jgi:hypothetical protein
MAIRRLRCPVRFTLTQVRRAMRRNPELIEGLLAEVVIADTAYDADPLRQAISVHTPQRATSLSLQKAR